MTWTVLYRREALKQLRKLPREAQGALHLAAEALAREPRPHGCRKMTGTDNRWRIRVGDYRVVYEIDEATAQVLVLVVGHRRDVYR